MPESRSVIWEEIGHSYDGVEFRYNATPADELAAKHFEMTDEEIEDDAYGEGTGT